MYNANELLKVIRNICGKDVYSDIIPGYVLGALFIAYKVLNALSISYMKFRADGIGRDSKLYTLLKDLTDELAIRLELYTDNMLSQQETANRNSQDTERRI